MNKIIINHDGSNNDKNVTIPFFLRFVGVGARRVRALFQAAKKKVTPIYCITTPNKYLQLSYLTFSILSVGSLHCFH